MIFCLSEEHSGWVRLGVIRAADQPVMSLWKSHMDILSYVHYSYIPRQSVTFLKLFLKLCVKFLFSSAVVQYCFQFKYQFILTIFLATLKLKRTLTTRCTR